MNRLEEYQTLMAELERPVPALEGTLNRAKARRRDHLWARPLAGLATAAACFVLLVNFCAPVAHACAQVPILRELAELLRFNHSLSVALEHDYGQVIGQEQTENGVTVRVEYLIVDQKQVNIFYRLEGEADGYVVTPDLKDTGGGCSYWGNSSIKTGELAQISAVFVDRDVPDSLRLTLRVEWAETLGENDVPVAAAEPMDEAEPLAEFCFDLAFDPTYTTQGRTLALEQTFTIDGQTFTVDRVELYPTNCRFHLTANPENTMWLVGLNFYLELPDGTRLESSANGISASGSAETPEMSTFFAESSFFAGADQLELVVTGAQLMDKEQTYVSLDLTAPPSQAELPWSGVTLTEIQREGGQLSLTFQVPEDQQQELFSRAWTPEGEEVFSSGMMVWHRDEEEADLDGEQPGRYQKYWIEDYTADQILLDPAFIEPFTAAVPVRLTILLQ